MKNKRNFHLLGIIGGMGPFADIAFLNLLHSHTLGSRDCDYIPCVCDSLTCRPDRSDFLCGKSRKTPRSSLSLSLKRLQTLGADLIVMPCNTAHFWLSPLAKEKRRGTVIVNMVRVVASHCYENGYRRVCLLATEGTYRKSLYSEALFCMGVDLIYPDEKTKKSVYRFIAKVKSGQKAPITELEKQLSGLRCDAFVLGCTELSVSLLHTAAPCLKYVDSLSCLAAKVLELFGKKTDKIPYI